MTFDECVAIAQGWIAAFAEPSACEPALAQAGLHAHRVYQAYLESYATSPNDIALHRRCFAERAKQRASWALPLPFMRGDHGKFYESPFIREQRQHLASSYGLQTHKDILAAYPGEQWRAEVDPLERARMRQSWTRRPEYEQVWDDMQAALRLAIEAEAERFPRGEVGSFLPEGGWQRFATPLEWTPDLRL